MNEINEYTKWHWIADHALRVALYNAITSDVGIQERSVPFRSLLFVCSWPHYQTIHMIKLELYK